MIADLTMRFFFVLFSGKANIYVIPHHPDSIPLSVKLSNFLRSAYNCHTTICLTYQQITETDEKYDGGIVLVKGDITRDQLQAINNELSKMNNSINFIASFDSINEESVTNLSREHHRFEKLIQRKPRLLNICNARENLHYQQMICVERNQTAEDRTRFEQIALEDMPFINNEHLQT